MHHVEFATVAVVTCTCGRVAAVEQRLADSRTYPGACCRMACWSWSIATGASPSRTPKRIACSVRTARRCGSAAPSSKRPRSATAFRYAMSRSRRADQRERAARGRLVAGARSRPTDSGAADHPARRSIPTRSRPVQAQAGAAARRDRRRADAAKAAPRRCCERCTDAIVRNLDAALARIWTLDEGRTSSCSKRARGSTRDLDDVRTASRSAARRSADRRARRAAPDQRFRERSARRQSRVGAARTASSRSRAIRSRRRQRHRRARRCTAATLDHDVTRRAGDRSPTRSRSASSASSPTHARRGAETRAARAGRAARADHRDRQAPVGRARDRPARPAAIDEPRDAARRRAFGAFFYQPAIASRAPTPDARRSSPARRPRGAHRARSTMPELIRSDDIRRDARHSFELDVPIASFLAVPVIGPRRHDRRRARLRPRASTACSPQQTERLINGVAAQAAIAMDNARLFEEARELIDRAREDERRARSVRVRHEPRPQGAAARHREPRQWIEDDLGEKMDDQARYHMGLLRGRVTRLESLIDGILALQPRRSRPRATRRRRRHRRARARGLGAARAAPTRAARASADAADARNDARAAAAGADEPDRQRDQVQPRPRPDHRGRRASARRASGRSTSRTTASASRPSSTSGSGACSRRSKRATRSRAPASVSRSCVRSSSRAVVAPGSSRRPAPARRSGSRWPQTTRRTAHG